jgi:hypothetical protein
MCRVSVWRSIEFPVNMEAHAPNTIPLPPNNSIVVQENGCRIKLGLKLRWGGGYNDTYM